VTPTVKRRQRMTTCVVALGIMIGLQIAPLTEDAAKADAVKGSWSTPFDLGITAVHSIVLPSGKVLMISRAAITSGPLARLWDPATNTSINVSHPDAARDLYCAGHSILADGRTLLTGGNLRVGAQDGVKTSDLFDANGSQRWAQSPDLSQARWYPTNVQMGDGSVLVFGGQQKEGLFANTVDSYNAAATQRTQLPASATRQIGLYPRMHLMPDGRLFYSGVTTDPFGKTARFFNPATNSWSTAVDSFNFGVRGDGMSVLLPGLKKVLAIGGSKTESGTTGKATASTEIIDLSSANPQWSKAAPMNIARKESNSVMLPDGKLLVVGGAKGPGSYRNPVKTAEMFSPSTGTWTLMAAQTAPRSHHSTAVLLPDGRVLSAGQDRGTYLMTGEIYSPPYLFKGIRPVISSAPTSLDYGQQFSVSTPSAASIARVALIRAAAVTHSNSFDQRYVDLDFSVAGESLSVNAPATQRIAPPGYYMLFIVTSTGVPSIASWVHVGG
jgi:hypothetical protein